MKDYPIGSFIFWVLDKEIINDFQFYEFITHFHEKIDDIIQKLM